MTDVKLKFGEMIFEWDDDKNQINIQKHKIDFSKILKVFADENRIEFFDEIHSETEDRWQVIGKICHKINFGKESYCTGEENLL